jgi:hypothetical protein
MFYTGEKKNESYAGQVGKFPGNMVISQFIIPLLNMKIA